MSAATTLTDGLMVAKRNLSKIRRVPELRSSPRSPRSCSLLFAYVFGGAIAGGDPRQYRKFLMAGISPRRSSSGPP